MALFQPKMAHRLPGLWLFTDERITTAALIGALERLPRGSGVLFRHYSLPNDERRHLFDRVRRIARRRRLRVFLAGTPERALRWGADGWHGRNRPKALSCSRLLHSAPVHDHRELAAARQLGADLLFLSPVFATRSHPGKAALGTMRFAALCRQAEVPVMALGGMNPHRARHVQQLGAAGWGAIDALIPPSK